MSKTAIVLNDADKAALQHLLSRDITQAERYRINYLLGQYDARDDAGAAAFEQTFISEGVCSVMDANGGRGADFAKNQDQGFWAERLLRALPGDVQFVYFGLSDPVDPSDPLYEATRRKHRHTLLIEGKRPDLLAFPRSIVAAHPEILDWATRPLRPSDIALLQSDALAAVEIKSSLWHYATRNARRQYDRRLSNISVTVKDEEFADLDRWQSNNPQPRLIVMQVFVDSIFWTAYATFLAEKRAGRTRSSHEFKTGKLTNFLEIAEPITKRFADIVITEPGYQFPIMEKGDVERVPSWPAARLDTIAMPNFAQLP